MIDYSELKKSAEQGDDIPCWHAVTILDLIAELDQLKSVNHSLKGSCKALGEKVVRRKMQQLDRLKKENAQLLESIKIKEEFKGNADRFGEAMEKERNALKSENEKLHEYLSMLADYDSEMAYGYSELRKSL